MITLKHPDIRSISGGGGDTYVGKQFRDSLYYKLGYRQRQGDTIVVRISDSDNVKINNTKKEFQGINAMYKAHGWLYRNKIRCSDITAHMYLKESATLYPETSVEEQPTMKESVKVLQECAEMQTKKSQDYQSDESSVLQAMHYRRGVDTIHDVIIGKLMRATSLLESGNNPNYESLEDTYKDMINYASFAVSYMRGKMEGQRDDRDMFNKPKVAKNESRDNSVDV
jgi:hypothetical protein